MGKHNADYMLALGRGKCKINVDAKQLSEPSSIIIH